MKKTTVIRPKTAAEAIALVRRGIAAGTLDDLAATLDAPYPVIARLVQIAPRTLYRLKESGSDALLKQDVSERVLRMQLLIDRAVEVHGSLDKARAWLKSSCTALGGETPLAYAETEPGAREVENVLGRIEHGVFS